MHQTKRQHCSTCQLGQMGPVKVTPIKFKSGPNEQSPSSPLLWLWSGGVWVPVVLRQDTGEGGRNQWKLNIQASWHPDKLHPALKWTPGMLGTQACCTRPKTGTKHPPADVPICSEGAGIGPRGGGASVVKAVRRVAHVNVGEQLLGRLGAAGDRDVGQGW